MKQFVIQFIGPAGAFWVVVKVPAGVPIELIELAAKNAAGVHQAQLVGKDESPSEEQTFLPSRRPIFGLN